MMSVKQQNDFDGAKELCDWYKRIFNIVGVWPLQSAYLRSTLWTIYTSIQVVLDFSYALHSNRDMDMIMCLGELIWVFIVVPKLIVLRYSRKLPRLLIEIFNEMNDKAFDSTEEKEYYLAYNRLSISFFKIMAPVVTISVFMHYLMPFVSLIAALPSNQSVPNILPFRTYLFFDVNNYSTLALIWIYQIPMMYVNAIHPAAMGFVLFLIFHACGQLSALAFRIRHIGVYLESNQVASGQIFRQIVEKHHTIMRVTNDINDVFHILFFEELFMITSMIILTCHTVIVNSDLTEKGFLFQYVVYTLIMLTLIYGSCAAGEYLITESTNLYEAYYQCQWYDLPDAYKKQLIICMIGASKPIHLIGGGFYIFSLANFMNILKTAVSYVSLLRTMM